MSEPKRADARRNRARVLAAAEAVFGEKGTAAPAKEIAKAAKVGIGTVFRHFPAKEALLEARIAAGAGEDVRRSLGGLLRRAQEAGAVRLDLTRAEHLGEDAALRQRTLEIVFDGLRPRPAPGPDASG